MSTLAGKDIIDASSLFHAVAGCNWERSQRLATARYVSHVAQRASAACRGHTSPGCPPAACPASRLSSQSAICCIFGDIGFPFFRISSSIRVPDGTLPAPPFFAAALPSFAPPASTIAPLPEVDASGCCPLLQLHSSLETGAGFQVFVTNDHEVLRPSEGIVTGYVNVHRNATPY